MNPRALEEKDRAEFERLAGSVSTVSRKRLKERLMDAAWSDQAFAGASDVTRFVSIVNSGWVVRAARVEMTAWVKTLSRRSRNKMKALSPYTISWHDRVVALRMDKKAAASFENALHAPVQDLVDLPTLAGLHHGARCLADCSPQSIRALLHGLAPSWIRLLLFFHGDLFGVDSSRRTAPSLRRHWLMENAR